MSASPPFPPHVASQVGSRIAPPNQLFQYPNVMSCLILQAPECLDRQGILSFLSSVKNPCGSFRMQPEGETDMRGAYSAVAAAKVSGVLTNELKRGLPEYISSCQGFDGGVGGVPGAESHAGYAYCALATLKLLDVQPQTCFHIDRLLSWLRSLQAGIEGGFKGRPNKLVDSCYSFWVGASFALVREATGADHCLFDAKALENYVLFACQPAVNDTRQDSFELTPGFRDKPSKKPDVYHTAYALSGLAVAQQESYTGRHLGLAPVDPSLNVTRESLSQWSHAVTSFCAAKGLSLIDEETAGFDVKTAWLV
ncbi:MAG: uncharacterized protein KVP18_003287 [Porospora cf. gigantea A]|uniref:uncharacterized protein n=2 Tax=Porospora cf. gigantea A TaxID=2853593 RepID=UPI00355A5F3D|nr:MAG: hypothetical protein KVP18_003287 [Porospora cf. gigantea A]